jgi:hypothetical protein
MRACVNVHESFSLPIFLDRSEVRTEAMAKTRKSNEMGRVMKTVGSPRDSTSAPKVGL